MDNETQGTVISDDFQWFPAGEGTEEVVPLFDSEKLTRAEDVAIDLIGISMMYLFVRIL